ncbi:hypothetical protein GCM10028832_27400 [Streptomyces sparsus]
MTPWRPRNISPVELFPVSLTRGNRLRPTLDSSLDVSVLSCLEVSEEPPRSGVVSSPASPTYTLPFTWSDADSRQCAGRRRGSPPRLAAAIVRVKGNHARQ